MSYYITEKLKSKSFYNIEVLFIVLISIFIAVGLHYGISTATDPGCPTLKNLKKQEEKLKIVISEQEKLENTQESINNICNICSKN